MPRSRPPALLRNLPGPSWGRPNADAACWRSIDLLLAAQAELVDVIVAESGKARKDAVEEVFHLAMTAAYYGQYAAALYAAPSGRFPGLTRIDVRVSPPWAGVVLGHSPWNYLPP